METIVANIAGLIWHWPVTLLCLLGCVFFTITFKFIQIKCFPHAIQLISGKYDNPNEKGQITHFQALSAALSATIGLGNIAGVAIAIAVGGPGSVFWMWVIGFFGMATKYIECSLGTHYREIDSKTGDARGGPMHYITKGLGARFKPLATFYAFAISLAAFGAGCLFQANQAASALNLYYDVPTILTGVVLFALCFIVIIGGIKRIGSVASKIVPLMCIIYISCALLICLLNISKIPYVFSIILKDAFTGFAIAGGFVPVFFAGVRRAIFSNEAGLGSAAIAHAAVKTDYPIREGIVASLGPFIDTIVVCTATAIVIILSGNYGSSIYSPLSEKLMSFESKDIVSEYQQNWAVVDVSVAPSTPYMPAHIIDGNKVVEYKSRHNFLQPKAFFNISAKYKTIGFSYYKQSGDFQVNIYSQDKELLGVIDSQGNVSNPTISVDFFDKENQWERAIIHLNAPMVSSVSLQFIPLNDNVNWYLDSIGPVKKLNGIALTTYSFDHFFKGFGSIFITFSVLFFAFSTMITWSYYGETAIHFLMGSKYTTYYKLIFVCLIIIGATQTLDLIINISDALIGLLVIPNMIALILLHKKVISWTQDYFKQLHAGKLKIYK
tara:strand:- start:308 stop:2134 length:1827 start_codon:yes stop_codon:yes gene_type:complete